MWEGTPGNRLSYPDGRFTQESLFVQGAAMQNYVVRYFSTMKGVLEAQYAKSSLLGSPEDIGSVREKFCFDFLRDFLPAEVLITSGEVIDSFGQRVKGGQLDAVLYDSKTVRFNMDDHVQVLIVEGCLAAIEVKSTLNKRHLFLALDKCKEFKQLELSLYPLLPKLADVGYSIVDDFLIEQSKEVARAWKPNIEAFVKPKFYIFAYDGPASLKTVRQWIAEYGEQCDDDYHTIVRRLPDLICILNLGVVYKNDGFAFDLQPLVAAVTESGVVPNNLIFVPTREHEVSAFAIHLLEAARLSQRNSRLQAMGLSLNLKSYFAMRVEPEEEW
jgi:hypothetical protein